MKDLGGLTLLIETYNNIYILQFVLDQPDGTTLVPNLQWLGGPGFES